MFSLSVSLLWCGVHSPLSSIDYCLCVLCPLTSGPVQQFARGSLPCISEQPSVQMMGELLKSMDLVGNSPTLKTAWQACTFPFIPANTALEIH